MRKTIGIGLIVLVVAVAGGVSVAARVGFSRLYTLPESGELELRNTQKNAMWRPCVLSVICPNSASRTVTIYRLAGSEQYPLAQQTATAETYVYEFEGPYWSGLSNGVKGVVTPACTGTVEVIYE